VSSRDVLRLLKAEGWVVVRIQGSHQQLQHPTKPGTVTVPHPKKDLKIGTLKSIERQSGVKLA